MCSGMLRITSPRCSVSSSGRPAAGSSSSTTRGLPTTARAISTSRRSRAPSAPTFASRIGARARRSRGRRGRPRAAWPRPVAGVLVHHRDVVVDRQLLDRLLGLERAPQAPARAPEVRHRAAGRRRTRVTVPRPADEAAEHVEERGLAGAVGADQPAGARSNVDGHAVERRDAAEAHGQVARPRSRRASASRAAAAPSEQRRRSGAPELGHVLRELVDEALGRGQQHLQHADAEQDRQQVGGQAPVVQQRGQAACMKHARRRSRPRGCRSRPSAPPRAARSTRCVGNCDRCTGCRRWPPAGRPRRRS